LSARYRSASIPAIQFQIEASINSNIYNLLEKLDVGREEELGEDDGVYSTFYYLQGNIQPLR